MSYCLNPRCPYPQNRAGTEVCQACGSRLLLGDRYRAVRAIGQGGFGRTFLAIDEHKPSKPACVIKQFFPQVQGSTYKAAQLFRQEAEQLDELGNHPQIPELLAHFEFEHQLYLVQEYIDGKNLAQELAESGPFSEAQIRQLLADLLPVLDFIHRKQVIHRDIKPENIIRRRSATPVHRGNGSPSGAKPNHGDLVLVDFGASKSVTPTALERTGTRIGSAGFAAPEQLIGKAVFASDLYSLGVTCIHLLTDMPPFELYSVREGAWVWQDYLKTPVSNHLAWVLDDMLKVATHQRYQSADEVLRDLKADSAPVVQGGRPNRSVRPRLGKSRRFERFVLAGFAIAAFITLKVATPVPAILAVGSGFMFTMYVLNRRFQSSISVAEKFRLRGDAQALKQEMRQVEQSIRQLTDARHKLTRDVDQKARELAAQERVYDEAEQAEIDRIDLDLRHRLAAIQAEQENLAVLTSSEITKKLKRLQSRHRRNKLASYTLADAHVNGIGKALTQALEEAGITTAADVDPERLTHVSGVGDAKATNLMTWRQQVEAEIAASMPDSLPLDQQATIQAKYAQQMEELNNQVAEAKQAARLQQSHVKQRYQRQRVLLNRQVQTQQQHLATTLASLDQQVRDRQHHLRTVRERLSRIEAKLIDYRQISFAAYLWQILFPRRAA